MALSLGKPVFFLCDEGQVQNFYREVHPLSRLINFVTRVAVGAMVTSKTDDVSELLDRIFDNGDGILFQSASGQTRVPPIS
jgi:hypothetical protein